MQNIRHQLSFDIRSRSLHQAQNDLINNEVRMRLISYVLQLVDVFGRGWKFCWRCDMVYNSYIHSNKRIQVNGVWKLLFWVEAISKFLLSQNLNVFIICRPVGDFLMFYRRQQNGEKLTTAEIALVVPINHTPYCPKLHYLGYRTLCEIMRNDGHRAVQGHSRSPIFGTRILNNTDLCLISNRFRVIAA